MNKIFKLTLFFYLIINFINSSFSKENFFDEGLKLYNDKKYENARFMFERNIVFNPKNAESYLYLAKIFNTEENQEEEEKNLDTALLLEPNNEEAIYMLINIQLDRSNFEKANTLMNRFTSICKKMCNKKTEISKSLQDFEANNEKTN